MPRCRTTNRAVSRYGRDLIPHTAAAWSVHANMPRGASFETPLISAKDAYDVAAFINEQRRPHFAGLARDYQDSWLKPADVATPPWLGPFPPPQHKLGPWPAIERRLEANKPKTAVGQASEGDVEGEE